MDCRLFVPLSLVEDAGVEEVVLAAAKLMMKVSKTHKTHKTHL
jgi:hypothetical protein